MPWFVVVYIIIAALWLLAWVIISVVAREPEVSVGTYRSRPKNAEELAESRREAFIAAWMILATPVWGLIVFWYLLSALARGVWAVIGSAFDFDAVRPKKVDKDSTDF